MPSPFWNDGEGAEELVGPLDRSPWDTVYLGGVMLPGLCEIDDGECARKLDIKNAKGADGATITSNGYEPAKLTVKLVMWTPAQWVAFDRMLPLFKPKLGKPPSAPLTIDHPITATYKIDKVIVESVSTPKRGSTVGTREVTIKVVEWLPAPKKAGATSKTAKSGVPKTKLDQKNADWDAAYHAMNPNTEGPPREPPPSWYNDGPFGGKNKP